jgi:hypothetical protein
MKLFPKDSSKRVLLALLAAFVVPTAITLWMGSSEIVTPRELTADRMFITRRRIVLYSQEHGQPPASLTALPPLRGNIDSATTDAWGRPLDYSFDSSGVVTLRSLGADKMVGGDGDNRDLIGVFSIRDVRESSPWTHDPLKKL